MTEPPFNQTCRNGLLGACSVAIASLIPVALFQLRAIQHLPDPPGRWFDSDAITASPAAHPFGVPDSLPGLANYGVTLALILASDRSPRHRRWLAGKIALDGTAAAFNFARQLVMFGRMCSWCTVTAGATAVMVYKARPLLAAVAEEAIGAADSDADKDLPVLDALAPSG